MASAQPVPVPEGDLGKLFYRKTRLIHVELPAAVESGVDTKEVDDFRQEILDVMPPVPTPAKEGDDDAYVQGLRIAHIRLNHICVRLVRTASRVLLEKVKREIVSDNQSAVCREDIQRYRDEILGVEFSRTATTSNEEQWEQFRTKIREAVATLKAKTSSQEIIKGKDKVEKCKTLRFSDIVNDDDMDENEFEFEFDEASADIVPNTSFSDSRIELADDFGPFSTTGDKDKDPPLPSMFNQDNSSDIFNLSSDSFDFSSDSFIPSNDSFIPSNDSFIPSNDSLIPSNDSLDLSSGTFNSTTSSSYTDDVYPSSTFYYSIDDSEFNDLGFLLPDRDPEEEEAAEEEEDNSHDGNNSNNNGSIDPRLLQLPTDFNSSPPDSPLLSAGLERPETMFDF